MIMNSLKLTVRISFFSLIVLLFGLKLSADEDKKAMTIKDVMKFRSIQSKTISNDGEWVGYHTEPDRGDPKAFVQSAVDSTKDLKYEFERGVRPTFTNDASYAAVTIRPSAIDLANAERGKEPKDSLELINLENGERTRFDNVKKYEFSENSDWLVYVLDKKKNSDDKRIVGDEIVLRNLPQGAELPLHNVSEFAFDTLSHYFAYVVADEEAKNNGVYYIKLEGIFNFPMKIMAGEKTHYSNLTWNDENAVMSFVAGKEGYEKKPDSCMLMLWNSKNKELDTLVTVPDSLNTSAPEGWKVAFDNKLKWTKDGDRLFFGFKPIADTSLDKPDVKYADSTFFDKDTILKEKGLDLWHWNDPRIKTHQKKWWSRNKDRIFQAVYHTDLDKWTQLADTNLPRVAFAENPKKAIGYTQKPYLKEITWNGWFYDLYEVDLTTGERDKIVDKFMGEAHISPSGDFIVYYKDKSWYSYDCRNDTTIHLTKPIEEEINFYNVEFDQPTDPPSYGFGGWLENDGAIIYSRYDIWMFFPNGDGYLNLTAASGKVHKITYRIRKLNPEKIYYKNNETVMITGFNEEKKTVSLSWLNFGILGQELAFKDDNRLKIAQKAKDTYKLLYTKETYTQYPDLWVADSLFKEEVRLTNYQEQVEKYKWGETELTRWVNSAGDTIRGWIVWPPNMEKGKKYPMLAYFYEKFSDYYNRFWDPKIWHLPCFQMYTGKDYVIFFPDIKYGTGNPGFDALDCVVSGVRKVMETGWIDSTAIGIQGHSWGGYETAFLITQTDLFAAAVSGAPVGNMTSAYSGIRLGTGLARQFQYEKYQSRIGGALWDSLDNYLNNSPIFQARKIDTPFMLMFGDKDQAVPWEQGIELYLALRRLNKNCVFLQYRGEPHWPSKFPNKLDYTIKMMQFFDHYLKGEPAPKWLLEGVEYRGR